MTSLSKIKSKSIFVDYSGSTGNSTNYWFLVGKILEKEYALHGDKLLIVFWGTSAEVVNISRARWLIKYKIGNDGTNPTCFVNKISANSDIIIITDGQVSKSCVDNCDKAFNNMPLDSVEVYFINTGGSMNLSVSAAFTRNAKIYTLYENDALFASGSTANKILLSKYYGKPEDLLAAFEELFKTITLQCIGQMNMDLRNALLDLQKNLMYTIASRNSGDSNVITDLREAFLSFSPDEIIEKMKPLISCSNDSIGNKIERCIAALCNQCNGSNDFSFDQLKDPSRLMRAQNVKQVSVEEVPETTDGNTWGCPIMVDKTIPCLHICEGEPIFANLDKGYVSALMTFPFLVLNDQKLVQALKERIDHPCGLYATKRLFEDGDPKSPMTRRPLSCALSFGINSKEHDDANIYTLANLFFGTKLVGQNQFWLAVVYFVVKQIEYLNNEEFLKCFEEYLVFRLKNDKTNITLIGTSIEPMIKMPCDIAIWYSCHSPIFGYDDERNRLRSFGSTAQYLVKLLEILGYPIHDKVFYYMKIYRAFAYMMAQEKDNKPWRDLLRAQFQNSLTLSDGTIILLDGTPDHPSNDGVLPKAYQNLPEAYSDLPIGTLVKLSQLVDLTNTINTVPLHDIYAGQTAEYIPETNYGYPVSMTKKQAIMEVPVCPNTYRPYMVDKERWKHWRECSEIIFGPVDKQISIYNYYIDYVATKKNFPTTEDLIRFISEKQRKNDKHITTLPIRCYDMVNSVVQQYDTLLDQKVSVERFISVSSESRSRKNRVNMDESPIELVPANELV